MTGLNGGLMKWHCSLKHYFIRLVRISVYQANSLSGFVAL